MANGRLAKDVQYLRRHVRTLTEGQAEVMEVDENLEFIRLDIVPKDGLYKGARLLFKVYFPDEYPDRVPQVVCLTNFYHPNIDPEDIESADEECYSNICVSLLDEWDASMTLDHVVMAILFLMYNPAIDDALSPHFDSCITWEEYEENVLRSLKGLEVDGRTYECLVTDVNGNVTAASDNDKTCLSSTDAITAGSKNTVGCEVNDTDAVFNEDDAVSTELLLNRQNSFACGTVIDSLLDSTLNTVIMRKNDFKGAGLQLGVACHFCSKFVFDSFSFARTVPASLSISALFPGFQHYDATVQAFAPKTHADGIDSEVD